MNMSKRKLTRTLTVMAAGIMALSGSSIAQAAEPVGDYPSRPITIVVGFSPGGATDVITRLVAVKLSAVLGQPIVVENKPGASSNIATEAVVRAAPDGYTLLVETIANATNMSVYKNLRYDTVRDLKPIIQFMGFAQRAGGDAVAAGDGPQVADCLWQGRAGQVDFCFLGPGRLAASGR